MSLTCFFGMEIQPDGNPVAPIIPPKSTLVITQVCVTAAFPTGGAVTLYVQSHNITSKLAVCTLHPDKGIFHWAVQLLFSGSVTFFLAPTNPNLPSSGSQQKKAGKKGASQEEAAAEAKELVQLPTVHIMGYYEAEDEGDDEDEEEEDEEDASDDGEFVSSARGGRGKSAGGRARGAASAARGRGRR